MDYNQNHTEETNSLINDKIRVARKLITSSADAYTALKTLASLELKRVEQFKTIQSFLNLFYNETSYQRPIIEDLIDCISIKIERLEQQVNLVG